MLQLEAANKIHLEMKTIEIVSKAAQAIHNSNDQEISRYRETSKDRTVMECSEQENTGQDRTGQDRTGQELKRF